MKKVTQLINQNIMKVECLIAKGRLGQNKI